MSDKTTSDQPDIVCQHGRALDVHCCNCHSGFLFDAGSCVCHGTARSRRPGPRRRPRCYGLAPLSVRLTDRQQVQRYSRIRRRENARLNGPKRQPIRFEAKPVRLTADEGFMAALSVMLSGRRRARRSSA